MVRKVYVKMSDFSYKKGTQGVVFLLTRVGQMSNKMRILKLLFLADRHHIRHYGRPIFNDRYFAMQRGPVASGIKDILDYAMEGRTGFTSDAQKAYADECLKQEGAKLQAIVGFDDYEFSESDIMSLEWSIEQFSGKSADFLSNITHEYNEWKMHEKSLAGQDIRAREPMEYIHFFEESDPSEAYFKEDPELLEVSKEVFEESERVAAVFA